MLLTDVQVQEFICNGFLQLKADVSEALNQKVDEKIRWAIEHEFAMGNNILPRVPEMYEVLDCDVLKGALTSLLGSNYLLHPHRAVHSSTPVEEEVPDLSPTVNAPAMGKGSMAGSGWHQDAQSPLSRARYHHPRHLILFYFPHDTPRKMGPTRIQAGCYMYARPTGTKYMLLPEFVPAGSLFLVHFDTVHAGFSNLSDRTRYMVKFIFSRTANPTAPTWHNSQTEWTQPNACLMDDTDALEPAWSNIWQWLQGKPLAELVVPDVERYLVDFDNDDQTARLNAIHTLGRTGIDSIKPLIEKLLSVANTGRAERSLRQNKRGEIIPVDKPCFEARWNERAIVMEDATYALALLGRQAVPAITELLKHEDPWIQLNAAFALGEIADPVSVESLSQQLNNPYQQVVRQTLDALGVMGGEINAALPHMERLLKTSNPDWQDRQVMRGWTAENQIRLNVVFALINAIEAEGSDLDKIEELLTYALDDENGYVPDVACEGLKRIGTHKALASAVHHLQRQRWDSTLVGKKKLF
ncbi:MAG: HEAT repeat domain-containing protein [Pseudomonadota bacterium]